MKLAQYEAAHFLWSAEGSVALVKDPVCGTYIRRVDALSARAGAKTHYFCSERCQQAFLKTA